MSAFLYQCLQTTFLIVRTVSKYFYFLELSLSFRPTCPVGGEPHRVLAEFCPLTPEAPSGTRFPTGRGLPTTHSKDTVSGRPLPLQIAHIFQPLPRPPGPSWLVYLLSGHSLSFHPLVFCILKSSLRLGPEQVISPPPSRCPFLTTSPRGGTSPLTAFSGGGRLGQQVRGSYKAGL